MEIGYGLTVYIIIFFILIEWGLLLEAIVNRFFKKHQKHRILFRMFLGSVYGLAWALYLYYLLTYLNFDIVW